MSGKHLGIIADDLGSGVFHLGNDFDRRLKHSIFVRLMIAFSYRIFLSIFLVLAVPLMVCSQVYRKARSITTENGLSDNRVTCFYKDKTGFTWIGTKNGLNRYDGHRITIFRPTAGNSISNEIINDIAEDNQGKIWVATMNGLNKYDPLRNHWESFLPLPTIAGNDIPSNLIWDIHIDKKNRVWIASDVREFSYYEPETRKFVYFDWPG
ncbi:MAG TPA: two-component regulator propeller domain-containing protein, partial [Flavisolibacter sp.]